jgi:hypothetical protein
VLDVPLWLVSLVGPSLVGASALAPPASARLVALLVLLPLLVGLVFGLPHSKQNRFFMLGALLCLPPLFTTLPQDRLLIAASFGAFGLLASFLEASLLSASWSMRGFAHAMAALHLGLAPLLFLATVNTNAGIERGTQAIVAAVDALPRAPERHVIIVNTPVELLTMYSTVILRHPPATHLPDSLHQLYTGVSELVAERIDANTLQLTAARGWGRIPFERIFCAAHYMPRAGAEIDLPTMHVSVLEANEHGMPYRVQFRFPNQLEAPERAWYTWQHAGPRPWHPPALGERITLPALEFVNAL